ncbi:MAG: DNA-binding protein WhiA [Clostridia bacterium]|nr:DNA-binding protein WhiA [Clostridia bacterium]
MSFCSDIKNELSGLKLSSCCKKPLIYGFLLFSRSFSVKRICMQTENERTALSYAELLKEVYSADVKISCGGTKSPTYIAEVKSEADRLKILASVDFGVYDGLINRECFLRECCVASFVRGAFLACGHLSNPEVSYRADFPVKSESLAKELCNLLSEHYISAHISRRGNGFVVYIKRSEMIVNLLTLIGASARSLELIETTIIKSVKNNTNRARNCDSGNINRTVEASVKQRKAIEYLKKTDRLESLPKELLYTAKLRLENPDATLKELCAKSHEPITVSGLNHRLNKIMEIYNTQRNNIKK